MLVPDVIFPFPAGQVLQAEQAWFPAEDLNVSSGHEAQTRSDDAVAMATIPVPAAQGALTAWQAFPSLVVENVLPIWQAGCTGTMVRAKMATSTCGRALAPS